jgi:hypothetical protein
MTEKLRGRAFATFVLTAVVFAAIAVRPADIQVFAARRYDDGGRSQDTRVIELPALRGAIGPLGSTAGTHRPATSYRRRPVLDPGPGERGGVAGSPARPAGGEGCVGAKRALWPR